MSIIGKALGAGGGYLTIGAFVAGTGFGAWVYAGQIAKRDLKDQRVKYEQKVLDLEGEVEAKDLKISNLKSADEEGLSERNGQAQEVIDQTRNLKRTVDGLRRDLQKEKKPYYEIELPNETIYRVNCAFRPSLCINETSQAEGHPNNQRREDQYSGQLAGAPRSGNDRSSSD